MLKTIDVHDLTEEQVKLVQEFVEFLKTKFGTKRLREEKMKEMGPNLEALNMANNNKEYYQLEKKLSNNYNNQKLNKLSSDKSCGYRLTGESA